MMKKLLLLAAVLVLASFMAFACFADAYEYYPDSEGYYVVDYAGKPSNEYLIIVIKGLYDETNFVEAYNNAGDNDILFYDQISSDDDGKAVFGPFVPTAYFDATVIIGGTDLSSPILAGYIKTAGISNVTGVEIQDVLDTYTVKGFNGKDVVIDVNTTLIDAFGYPAITDEKAVISVSENTLGVVANPVSGTVTIDRFAQEGEFTITATYGDYSDSKTVAVVREESVPYMVVAYTDEETKQAVDSVVLELVQGTDMVETTIYCETRDQYKEKYEDVHIMYVNGEDVGSTYNFEFTSSGTYTVKFARNNNLDCYTTVTVEVKDVKPYEGNAYTLYELIKSCENDNAFIGKEKFISADGKDVYPQFTWTTAAKQTAFEGAIETAKQVLVGYDEGSKTDSDIVSAINTLESARSTYEKSFKPGVRVDIQSLTLNNQNIRIPVTDAKVAIEKTMIPAVNTDKITWTSSDPETVYVDADGYMVAKENGTVIITATTRTGIVASTTVTAYTKATRIYLSESSLNLVYGSEPYVLKVTAYPATQTEILTWSSSNPDVATVDQSGKVTLKPKAGRTFITVVGEHGLASQCEIKVTLPGWETVQAPVADVAPGGIFKGTQVSLTTATDSAKIYYTLDGSEPNEKSRPYTGPITINSSLTLKAIAVADRMFDSQVAVYEYDVVLPEVSVSETTAVKGGEAKITLNLKNNPGITKMSLKVSSMFVELVEVEAGDALSSLTLDYDLEYVDNGYIITWTGDTADTSAGEMATLTFKISEDAPAYEYDVGVTVIEALDADGMDMDVETEKGKIKVLDVAIGDVNADDSIDLRDVILLAQYCAGWPSAVETVQDKAADANGDDKIDLLDVIHLSQYCAGWDVTLG